MSESRGIKADEVMVGDTIRYSQIATVKYISSNATDTRGAFDLDNNRTILTGDFNYELLNRPLPKHKYQVTSYNISEATEMATTAIKLLAAHIKELEAENYKLQGLLEIQNAQLEGLKRPPITYTLAQQKEPTQYRIRLSSNSVPATKYDEGENK